MLAVSDLVLCVGKQQQSMRSVVDQGTTSRRLQQKSSALAHEHLLVAVRVVVAAALALLLPLAAGLGRVVRPVRLLGLQEGAPSWH